MQLAPPKATENALRGSGKAFEEFAAEVGLQDVRVVFCGMPSSASSLRRLIGAPRADISQIPHLMSEKTLTNRDLLLLDTWDTTEDVRTHRSGKSTTSIEDRAKAFVGRVSQTMFKSSSLSSASKSRGRDSDIKALRSSASCAVESSALDDTRPVDRGEKFLMQWRVAFMGKEIQMVDGVEETSDPDKEVPHWEFAGWMLPLEVNVCQPLIKQLELNFKPRVWVPRWCPPVGNDISQTFRKLRAQHDENTVKRLKKKRKMEKILGRGGPGSDLWITGEVLLRGEMRAARYDAYSEATWLKRNSVVPKGKMKIERLVGPARCRVGFIPTREKNGPFFSKDGWLFANEFEALAADKLIQGGMVREAARGSADSRPEDAGCDAYEDPTRNQEPIFALPDNVLRNWGYNPSDGSRRSRFRPPVSALGVKPWKKPASGARILPGCPKELQCCISLERNLPTALEPAVFAMKAAMPENCASDWSSNPCTTQCARPSFSGEESPRSATRSEENGTKPLIPPVTNIAVAVTPTGQAAVPRTPDALCGWAKAKYKEEERAKVLPASPPNAIGIDAMIEAVSHESLGLPAPSLAKLHEWWRSMGIMLD
jgi:hypothetical protein